MKKNIHIIQFKYALKPFLYLPITFIKRVLWGSDPVAQKYFWNKWGFIEKNRLRASQKNKIIWIDVSSGGEMLQIVTFCSLIKNHFPQIQLFLSTESKDAYDFAKTLETIDFVFFSPWDLKCSVRRILKKINPLALVTIDFTELAILFREAKKMGIKTTLLSAHMDSQWLRHPQLKKALALHYSHFFDFIGAQTTTDYDEFKKMGVEPQKISITGNMKLDLKFLSSNTKEKIKLKHTLRLKNDEKIFLAAMTNIGEEKIILSAYLLAKKEIPNLRLIIAPRYSEYTKKIEEAAKILDLHPVKMSSLLTMRRHHDLIMIDTFGSLSLLYSFADYIFMGESINPVDPFGLGHSPIPMLACEKAILFGPYMNQWKAFTEPLKSIWKGCEVHNTEQLANSIIELHRNKVLYTALQKTALNLVNRERDPITENFLALKSLIEKNLDREASPFSRGQPRPST